MTTQNEIVLYRPDETLSLDVRVEEDTVWLTQQQMVELFQSSKANISEHIKSIYTQQELEVEATVRKNRTVRKEGNRMVTRELDYYNLDVIISVGFRVNTKRGIAFRRWANTVLKQYMLSGYAFAQRFERLEHRMAYMEERQDAFDIEIHAALPPTQGIFYEGQVFDARVFVENLIRSAKREIVLIDTYVNSDVIAMLNERGRDVTAILYTDTISQALRQAEELSEKQHGRKIELKQYGTNFHDRFLIIDDDLYHFGASFKDLGKRLFGFEKMGLNKQVVLSQL